MQNRFLVDSRWKNTGSEHGRTKLLFLSLNVTDLLKLVKQQQAVIAAYERYYEAE